MLAAEPEILSSTLTAHMAEGESSLDSFPLISAHMPQHVCVQTSNSHPHTKTHT